MKISKSDLQQIIKEEAVRLYQLEKLEEAKRVVDLNLKLVSEGKKKMSDEELEELWAGIKNVLGAGAKAVGQAAQAGVQKAQQLGQKAVGVVKQNVAGAPAQTPAKPVATPTKAPVAGQKPVPAPKENEKAKKDMQTVLQSTSGDKGIKMRAALTGRTFQAQKQAEKAAGMPLYI